jgi:competence protein ComEA
VPAPSQPTTPVDVDELLRRPPPPPAGWRTLVAARAHALDLSPLRIGVAVAVVVVAVAGLALLVRTPSSSPPELSLPMAGTGASPGAATAGDDGTPAPGDASAGPVEPGGVAAGEPAAVVVHAAGAVVRPGLYRLPAGARVDDLLAAAGGAAPDADPSRLNLAAVLLDGQRLFVPRPGEEPPPEVVADGGPGGGAGAGEEATPADPVDLNRASPDELDRLPGIGPATATAIVAHRDAHGPFAAVDALLDVRGIGPAKLEQLRPLVRV